MKRKKWMALGLILLLLLSLLAGCSGSDSDGGSNGATTLPMPTESASPVVD